jgi:ArsR family transcriptional regulator
VEGFRRQRVIIQPRSGTLKSIDLRALMSSETSLDRTLHAISDPTRRKILQVLREGAKENARGESKAHAGSLCAGDIEQKIQLSQPTISHHMAILTKAGLVEASKEGQWRWYRRNEKAIRQMLKSLRGKL